MVTRGILVATVTLLLVGGIASPASAWYIENGPHIENGVPMDGWAWKAPDGVTPLTQTVTPITGIAPDAIEGQKIGYFTFNITDHGDKGNIFLPTMTNVSAGSTIVIKYDIMFDFDESKGNGICTGFPGGIRPVLVDSASAPDSSQINTEALLLSECDPGQWYHVEVRFELPEGFTWTGDAPPTQDPRVVKGSYDFLHFISIGLQVFRNDGISNMAWWATNISVEDITADFTYVESGDFTQFYVADGAAHKIEVFTVAVPEPATMSLLALGGLAMLRRRK